MMEEGDEALGLDRTICWLSEQAGMWIDSVDRTITEPVHVDKLARMTAAMEGIEREANAKSLLRRSPSGHGGRRRNPFLPRCELPSGL